ncbi:MAG: hypothetical protein NTY94_07005 [Alphaproteobacteria bacterium]|nr:hypothetical protein [Alphaproteobacteria bacterium]
MQRGEFGLAGGPAQILLRVVPAAAEGGVVQVDAAAIGHEAGDGDAEHAAIRGMGGDDGGDEGGGDEAGAGVLAIECEVPGLAVEGAGVVLAAGVEQQARRIGGGVAEGGGAGGELGADGADGGTLGDQAQAAALGPDLAGGFLRGFGGLAGFAAQADEIVAVAGIEVAFAAQALAEHDVVAGEFDVEIGDAGAAFAQDGGAVFQVADRDQHAIDVHGVVGREPEVAVRAAGAEGVGADADGPHLGRAVLHGALHGAAADPDDGEELAGEDGDHVIPGLEVFHRDLPLAGEQACAFGEAGGWGVVPGAIGGEGEDLALGERGVGDDVVVGGVLENQGAGIVVGGDGELVGGVVVDDADLVAGADDGAVQHDAVRADIVHRSLVAEQVDHAPLARAEDGVAEGDGHVALLQRRTLL